MRTLNIDNFQLIQLDKFNGTNLNTTSFNPSVLRYFKVVDSYRDLCKVPF